MFVAYAALIVAASLNRETGGILVALYIAYFLPEWRFHWRRFLLLAMIWAAIQASIHLALGPAPHMLGLAGTLRYNLDYLPDAIFANLPFIPLLLLALRNFRHMSALRKRLMAIVVLYLVAIGVGAAWNETERLILPVLPLVLFGVEYAL